MSETTCMRRSRTGLANAWSVRLAPWSKAVDSLVITSSAIFVNTATNPSDAAANASSRRASDAGSFATTEANSGPPKRRASATTTSAIASAAPNRAARPNQRCSSSQLRPKKYPARVTVVAQTSAPAAL